MQKQPSFGALNARLPVHMLKLGRDSQEAEKFNRFKKKEHPLGCSKVSGRRGKKTGDAYKRRKVRSVPKKFQKILRPSQRLIEVTFSQFRAELPVGANTGRGRDQRSPQGTVAAFSFLTQACRTQ
jgi:hypothetical protein